ncbi:glycosyltransferase family 4 protein [Colwellia sp. MEBiC06753]
MAEAMKVCLVDPIGSGHHSEYVKAVLTRFAELGVQVHFIGAANVAQEIKGDINSYTVLDIEQKTGFLSKELSKVEFIKQVYETAIQRKCQLIHFLYLDRNIRALYRSKCISKLPTVATLHWGYMISSVCQTYRQKLVGFIDSLLLKNLTNKGLLLCVHSERVASLLSCREGAVSSLNYPIKSSYKFNEQERNQYREELGVEQGEKLLLCFGGTRRDKGADKALKSIVLLPEQYKLLVIGAEQDILFSDLAQLADNLGINHRVILKKQFVEDDKVNQIFSAADCLLLPYDESFSGQSGPLTIAAAVGVPVIASNSLVLEESIRKYNLGQIHQWREMDKLQSLLANIDTSNKKGMQDFIDASSFNKFSQSNVLNYQKFISQGCE